jgi:trehalose 6-phosphate phosphatase
MVFEIKPSGRDKGRAIEEFLDEPPFVGRMPVFVGDDVTDEYGFIAVNARGGVSIKVGDGETAATLRLPNVEAVHRWLRDVLAKS